MAFPDTYRPMPATEIVVLQVRSGLVRNVILKVSLIKVGEIVSLYTSKVAYGWLSGMAGVASISTDTVK